MLDEIKEALETEFELPVFYGSSMEATGQKIYDYIVFWRDSIEPTPGVRGDRVIHYNITLVRRDYIPEGDDLRLLNVVNGIKGLKRNGDLTYEYMTMPSTALALEALTCPCTQAIKEC